jgi:uracil-DNA glycosylase family 4
MFIGEAPGATEDQKGIPFVGDSGQFLREAMPKAWRENVYWTNICRCRPPQNRRPTESEAAACASGFLDGDLARISPHVVVAVGDLALDRFAPGYTITKLRGIPIPIELGNTTAWLYAIWHPSYVIRSRNPRTPPGDDKFNVIYPVWRSDLDRLWELERICDRPSIPKLPIVFTPETLDHAKGLYATLKAPYAIDFEHSKLKPYMRDAKLLTAALSDGVTTFAFPIQWPGIQNPWGMEFLKYVMNTGRKGWIAHNASNELVWSWFHAGVPTLPFFDTMAKQKFIFNRTGLASLDTQTLIHLGQRIKDATDDELARALRRPGEHILRFGLQDVLKYNGYDGWATKLVDERQQLPKDQYKNYERALASIKSTVRMELLGLPIDFAETHRLKVELTKQADEIEENIRAYPEVENYERECNTTLRLTAPQDIATVLVKYCGLRLPALAKANTWSTDDSNLQELVGQHPIVEDIQDHREVMKLKSTYVDPIIKGEILGADGNIHPSGNVVLTATGRLSFDSPSIQNFPKRKHREIRKQIIAPKGCLMVSGDYAQLEARVLAMASKDKALCESIIKKVDIHTKWLNKCIEAYPTYLDRLSRKTGETEEKLVRKAARDIIKTDFVFASFYGSIIKSVATRTQIPEPIVADLWNEFWDEHEGVLEWQQKVRHEYWKTGTVQTLTHLKRNEILPGNEPINTPIQGTAAHIVLEAQNAISDMADVDITVAPRINIHDDITFIIPDDGETEGYIELLAEEMVRPRFDFVTVPLAVEMKIGENWMELDEIGKWEGEYYAGNPR